jgi:hypothetical protein
MSRPTPSAIEQTLGTDLVHAIARQDARALRRLIATPVTFRAVTPRRFWDAETAVEVADVMVGVWFGPDKKVTDISWLAADSVGDVAKVSYRLLVDLATGPSVIEQVIYYTVEEGLIVDLRLVCSGFRPIQQPDALTMAPAGRPSGRPT